MGDVVQAAPKKIILCCDGTFQSSTTGTHSLPSNVTRLARTIAKAGKDKDGKVWQQMVYYVRGVGTGALSTLEVDRQGATGDGLVVNVLDAYNFVVNNYTPGDKIYCFGFSRGAFTARAVAGMITDFGVIKPDNMKYFADLFAIYQKNLQKYNFQKTKEYFEFRQGKAPLVPQSQKDSSVEVSKFDMGVPDLEYPDSRTVELVGVFDTVGSLGMSDTWVANNASDRMRYEWLNVKWNPYIKHAFHAMSLDDRRQPFLPTLYYIPFKDVIAAENEILRKEEVDWPELTKWRQTIDKDLEKQKRDTADLVQVWFTGVHINVGGGQDDAKTDFEGLANITFAWMVEQCRPYLAFEDFTNALIANYLERMFEDNTERALHVDQVANAGVVGKAVTVVSDELHKAEKWLGSWTHAQAASKEKAESDGKMVRSYNMKPKPDPPTPTIRWTLFRVQDSYSLLYQAISAPANRSPGACDDKSTETHTPLSKLGDTNEWVHPSVKWRTDISSKDPQKDFHYVCAALGGFVYQQKDGVYGWYKAEGKVWVPEWPLTSALEEDDPNTVNLDSEMALVDECLDKAEVRNFLKKNASAWLAAQPKAKV